MSVFGLELKSLRELILLCLSFILGAYALLFHPHILESLEEIASMQESIAKHQSYLASSPDLAQDLASSQALNQKLSLLVQELNAPSLSAFEALKQINAYALKHKISLWESDYKNEGQNYQLKLVGLSPLKEFFSLLSFAEGLPLLHIDSFDFSHKGDFSLKLQNHKILGLLPADPSLQPDLVLASLQRIHDTQPIVPNTEEAELKLEALFNHRAKINGIWLKEGESIQGYTVQRIEAQQVILRSPNASLILK